MRISLRGLRQIALEDHCLELTTVPADEVLLNVLCCAVCRTDAKIWNEGHRDLHLPRVPGHEIVAEKGGKRYVVWPGISCGECKHCVRGDENLCKTMQIIGFHMDGGFAHAVKVPYASLIPVPQFLSTQLATFAEPAGCIVNAFRKLNLCKDERILIYGAGTVGLLAALLAKHKGAHPVVLENNEVKKLKATAFVEHTGIPVLKETSESYFDCVLNACPDPLALFCGITKLDKGGRLAFFSGLSKNKQLESNLLNLVHYKELTLVGSYGLTKKDMETGVGYLEYLMPNLEMLIEKIISPEEVETILPEVLGGIPYKYIIDFENYSVEPKHKEYIQMKNKIEVKPQTNLEKIEATCKTINVPSEELRARAQHKIDFKTKPLGSLGKLEIMAVQMSLIQKDLNPVIGKKAALVFAADHGIAEEGVSAFPQEVTQQMVHNFLKGGAAINVLCKHNNIDISIVDMGVKGLQSENPALINKRIGGGTRNFATEPAMSPEQAAKALLAGMEVFEEVSDGSYPNIVGLGEMGIANTTSAAAIISTITQKTVKEVTWRGTGVDDQGLEHKVEVLEKALAFHQPDPKDAIDILSKVGGFEVAAMAGAALAAAAQGCAVVLDGLISTAAGLLAYTLNPNVVNYFIAGHNSVEIGHVAALQHMGLEPVLDLDMRLGEGTGAALTIGLAEAACNIMSDMASFEEAGVSNKDD